MPERALRELPEIPVTVMSLAPLAIPAWLIWVAKTTCGRKTESQSLVRWGRVLRRDSCAAVRFIYNRSKPGQHLAKHPKKPNIRSEERRVGKEGRSRWS